MAVPPIMGHFSAHHINRVKGEANLSLHIKGVFVLLPVNLCSMPETLICGVDGLQGGNSTLRSWASAFRLVSASGPVCSGLLRSVLVEKDVCFTPGFDHLSAGVPAEEASGFAEVAAAFMTFTSCRI